jgi:phenylacetate-CoA ligase
MQNALCTLWGIKLNRQRYGGGYPGWAAAWAETRTWTESQLRAYQLEQVQLLIAHCYSTVPFYADAWRSARRSPSDLRTLDDLACFPFTTKDQVFEAGRRFVSRLFDRKRLIPITTGGTTGQPLTLYRTPEELRRHYAAYWDRLRPGVKRGDRYAAFQGKEVVPATQVRPPYWRDNHAANQRLYSMRHLSPAKLDYYIKDIARTPFVYYQGYANFLALIAEHMADRGVAPELPPRAVFSTSDQLSESMRRLMETTWQTRVWDEYGQAEQGAMIFECEMRNRHAQMDYGVIEYLPVAREDGLDVAEIVCTGFIPRAMPLIRYRIGDHVLIDPIGVCQCGRPGPVIKAIRGRTSEFIVTPDGRRYPTVTHFVDLLRNVRRTQVVQEREGEIVVRIIPLPMFSDADARHAAGVFADRVGGGIAVRVEVVSELERNSNGKVLNIINRMPGYRSGALSATERD